MIFAWNSCMLTHRPSVIVRIDMSRLGATIAGSAMRVKVRFPLSSPSMTRGGCDAGRRGHREAGLAAAGAAAAVADRPGRGARALSGQAVEQAGGPPGRTRPAFVHGGRADRARAGPGHLGADPVPRRRRADQAPAPGRVGRGVPGHPAQPRPVGAAGRRGGADRRPERHRRGPRAPGAGPAGEDRAGGRGVVAKTVAASKLPVAGSPTDRTGLETAVEPMRLIRVIAYPGRWSPRGKSDSFRPNWLSRWARSALSSAFGHGVPVRLDKSLASGRKSRATAMCTAIADSRVAK